MPKDKTQSIAESIQALQNRAEKLKPVAIIYGPTKETKGDRSKIMDKPFLQGVEKLKKDEKPTHKGVESNGGARKNSGRKPLEQTLLKRGIKAFIDEHVNEKVKVQITDPKTGKTLVIEKPRVAVVLQQLYAIGMGTTDKGNAPALKEWLDRAVGKAPQPIRGDGDDDTPIKLEVDISKILEKAYGQEE